MKNILHFLALVLIGISCSKKENNSPGISNSGCLIADATDSATNQKSYSCTYDANRRITKFQQYDNGVEDLYTTFTYGPGIVTLQFYLPGGVAIGRPVSASINSKGYNRSDITSKPDTVENVPGITKDTLICEYKSDDKLETMITRSTTYANGSNAILRQIRLFSHFIYSGNRLMERIDSNSTRFGNNPFNKFSSTTEYTYDVGSPTVKVNPVIDQNDPFFGNRLGSLASDKIPVKAVKKYDDFGSRPFTSTTTYTAVVDAKGNPTKIRSGSGGSSPSFRTQIYTYNCQ